MRKGFLFQSRSIASILRKGGQEQLRLLNNHQPFGLFALVCLKRGDENTRGQVTGIIRKLMRAETENLLFHYFPGYNAQVGLHFIEIHAWLYEVSTKVNMM